MSETSPKYSLNSVDLQKIGKGAAIAVGGVLITYLLQIIPDVNFGNYSALVTAVSSILLNAASKWLAGQK